MELRSPGPHEKENPVPIGKETRAEKTYDGVNDQESSGGSDTIVPEVSKDKNYEKIEDNESPMGGKHNPRPNPALNFTDEYRYYTNM